MGMSDADMQAEKIKPSASASPSATASTSDATIPSAEPTRYPVTPIASSAPVSAEMYNGQDASDDTLSDIDQQSTMDTMSSDNGEQMPSSEDFTAPYQ
jgi:hypothetical protein